MNLKAMALVGVFFTGISVAGCHNAYMKTMGVIEETLIGGSDLPRIPCDYGVVDSISYDPSNSTITFGLKIIGHRQGHTTRTFYGEQAERLYHSTRMGDHISSCPEFSGSRNFQNTLKH